MRINHVIKTDQWRPAPQICPALRILSIVVSRFCPIQGCTPLVRFQERGMPPCPFLRVSAPVIVVFLKYIIFPQPRA